MACVQRAVLLLSLVLVAVAAQDQRTRQIIPEEFITARPAKGTLPVGRSEAYHRVGGSSYSQRSAPSGLAQVGMTIWRLRPAKDADSGVRLLIQEGSRTSEWIPERVQTGTLLRQDDCIRLSFESANEGYLYVIDREQYADKRLGEPYLIFPTTRTRSGDNSAKPGRIIEIPGQEDRPNYLTVRPSRSNQTGELLSVIVSPQPLEGIVPESEAQRLSAVQVASWEKKWSTSAERFELASGKGQPWTKAEQEAGASGTRLLAQDEPGPQTIYRIAVREKRPLLFNVRLRYTR